MAFRRAGLQLLCLQLCTLTVNLHLRLIALLLRCKFLAFKGDARILRRLRCELLHQLHGLRDDRWQRCEHVSRVGDDRLRGLGQHAIERTARIVVLEVLHVLADVDAGRFLGQFNHGRHVPQCKVLLDVAHYPRQVRRRDELAATERWAHHVRKVRLEVGDVVLLRKRDDRSAQRGRDVLVDCVLLRWLQCWVEQLLRVRHAQCLKQTLLDLTLVVQLRQCGGALRHGLHLREALRLAEDRGVGHRHDIHRAFEVCAGGQHFADLVLHVGVVQIHRVEAVQDAQRAAHCAVQTRVDRREHGHALLDQGERRADWRVRVLVGQIVHGRADHALACVDHKAEQLEQSRRWRVERDRHGQLAYVVHVEATLDLFDLRRLDVQRLAAACAALQLEHRRDVLDVRAVHQCAQCAGRGSAEAADHVRQADWIRAAPRDERVLDEPV